MWTRLGYGLIIAFMLLLFIARAAHADTFYLEGGVYDALTAAPLVGAAITVPGTALATQALADGSYRLGPLSSDEWYVFVVSASGHQTVSGSLEVGHTRGPRDWYLLPQGAGAPPQFWKSLPDALPLVDPVDLDVDAEGQVYLLQASSGLAGEAEVQVFDAQGAFLRAWPAASFSGSRGPAEHPNVTSQATAIAVAPGGSVLVVQASSQCVLRFDGEGNLLNTISMSADWHPESVAVSGSTAYVLVERQDLGDEMHIVAYALDGTYLREWVVPFALGGSWQGPLRAAPDGSLYLLSTSMWHYAASGELLDTWTADALLSAYDFAISSHGNLYVGSIEIGPDEEQTPFVGEMTVYSPTGAALASWEEPADDTYPLLPRLIAIDGGDRLHVQNAGFGSLDTFTLDGELLARRGGGGAGADQFGSYQFMVWGGAPVSAAVAPDGTVWAGDPYNNRLKHLSATGETLGVYPVALASDQGIPTDGPLHVTVLPAASSADPSGYSVATLSDRKHPGDDPLARDYYVQIYSRAGAYQGEFQVAGASWSTVVAMAGDPTGNVWVADACGRVGCYDRTGTCLTIWDAPGVPTDVQGLAVAANGDVVLSVGGVPADGSSARVMRLDATGQLLSSGALCDAPYPDGLYTAGPVAVAPDDSYYELICTAKGWLLLHLDASWQMLDFRPLTGYPGWSVDGSSLALSPDGKVWLGDTLRMRLFVLTTGAFSDVAGWSWADSAIRACAAAGIVSGYADDTYRPTLSVTRDQMAVYVSRALAGGDAAVVTPASPATFSDVPSDYWAYRHIGYATEHGVVQGYDDGTYRPTTEVDRGQMAVFIARGLAGSDAAIPTPTGPATFADVPADFWSYRHIEYLADPVRSIVHGYDDGNYHPEYIVTRDQMAMYVARAFGGAW